ncbi:hypothetical protein [Agrobacterium pusense]|uniref:Uncharacterized protein n=1 Tax=Agrobacterium pusense TaxID=648995 RepID=U4Q4W7_9HYPH|nr:hypothetical protein [Agrobacterium pusense]CDI12278.1 conserved protein of unknown function [Agrobacterium pusense]
MLQAFRGKLLIVEQRIIHTFACRQRLQAAAAIVLSAVRSTRCVLGPSLEWDVDAAIVDVEIDDQTLLNVSIALENAKVPFVFANRAKSNDRGYSVSRDSAELREIADALFGPPGTLSTLH